MAQGDDKASERMAVWQLVNGFTLLFGCADNVVRRVMVRSQGKGSRRCPILVVGSSPSYAAGASLRRNDQGSVASRSGRWLLA